MGQHILLFESDRGFAQEVRTNFERIGATVDVANDGQHGLDLASAHRPDLILLSIELPGMNGFLVCKKIKKQDDLSGVPLLIMSSEATEDVFEQHKKLRTRADDYIHKPIAFSDLLERVKRFVAFEANGAGDADEIEIADLADDEVVLVSEDSAAPQEPERSEAEAFADEAVDRLVSDEPAWPRPAAPAPPRAFQPPAPVPDPITAVSSVETTAAADLGRVQHELRQAQVRCENLEGELASATRRAEQAEQELQAAKQRASAAERAVADAGKKGGVSSREFLDLREQLNRKDRELLALRDQVTSRDKQLIEANDRNLSLERELADVADKHVDLQRDLDKSKEVLDSLQADREGAKKRLDDLKARLERSEVRSRELSEELGSINSAHAKEVEALRQSHVEATAAAEARHGEALEQVRREHAATLESARRAHDEKLATLKHESEAALQVARDRAEQQKQALTAQRAEAEAQAQQRVAELQAKHEATISQALAAHENELSSTRQSLQDQHAEEMRQTTERSQQEIARLSRLLTELESRQQLLEDQLEEAEATKADLRGQLGRVTAERDRKAELSDTLKTQLDDLVAQRKAEQQVVERTRTALAIGLSLLEEHRTNAGDGQRES